jgi:pyruvate,water dikinase
MWITAINMMVRKRLLTRFLERHVPDVTTHQLLSGLVGLKSLEPNHRLRQIASRARDLDPAEREILLDGDDRTIRSRLRRTPAGRELVAEFDDFMSRYGFLSSSGTDFTMPPWREHPDLIWKAIGHLATFTAQCAEPEAIITRRRSVERVRSQLRFPRNWFFRHLLRSTRRYVRLRERVSFFMSEDIFHMRRLYLATGEHLARDGWLSERDDIFFLSFEELASIVAGTGDKDLLRKKISERKTKLHTDAAVDLEEVFYGEPRRWCRSGEQMTGPYLQGIAGSFGRARGYARIVMDPIEVKTPLTRHDILIVPHTDVGWTPLFPSIGGIVAETGGQLSHSAIIAREYGLPAVVSVKKATRIIHEGQPIMLDGDTGRVYLEHKTTAEEQRE